MRDKQMLKPCLTGWFKFIKTSFHPIFSYSLFAVIIPYLLVFYTPKNLLKSKKKNYIYQKKKVSDDQMAG